MSKGERRHDKMLDEIINNTSKIGVDSNYVRFIAKEPMLLMDKTIVAIPDILIIDRFCNNYIVEYKSSHNDRAYKQLRNAEGHLRETNISGNFQKIFAWGQRYKIQYEKVS